MRAYREWIWEADPAGWFEVEGDIDDFIFYNEQKQQSEK